jgi:putative transposase
MNRYRFIAAQKAKYSVARMCHVLEVAPSGFYAWQQRRPSARAEANRALLEQIRGIHQHSRETYGAPRVHAELRERKQRVSRKRVARLMRSAGLVGRPPRRFRRTTIADQQVQAKDLVQRQFTAAAPDQMWFGDITYIRTWQGWLYLAVLLDGYSRKVVGWAMADHLRTELASSALLMALRTRRPKPGLIHHTDRGVQTGFKESSQHLPRRCDAATKAQAIRSGAATPDALTGSPTGGTSRGPAAFLGGHRQRPDH